MAYNKIHFHPNRSYYFSSNLFLSSALMNVSTIVIQNCTMHSHILWQYNFDFIIWNKKMRWDTGNQSTSYNYQQHNSNIHNMKLMPKSYTFELYLKSYSLLKQLPSIRKHFPLDQVKMKDIEYLKNNDKCKMLFSYMKDFKVIDPAHTHKYMLLYYICFFPKQSVLRNIGVVQEVSINNTSCIISLYFSQDCILQV